VQLGNIAVSQKTLFILTFFGIVPLQW